MPPAYPARPTNTIAHLPFAPRALYRRAMCLLALAAAAIPTGVAFAQSKPAPVAVDAQFNAAQFAEQLIKVGGPPAFKGVKRVAITQFSAEFQTYDAIAARAGFGLSGSATQITRIHLGGIGQPEMQGLLNKLHLQFRQRMADAGFELMPQDQMTASAVYGRLTKAGLALPVTEDNRIVLSAEGLGFYGMNRGQIGAPQKAPGGALGGLVPQLALVGTLQNIGTGLGSVSIIPDSMELQKDLGGEIGLVEVHLKINFADLKGSTSTWGTTNTATTTARASPQINMAHLSLFTGTTLGTLSLEKPLALNPEAFVELKERPKSTGAVAGAVIAGALVAAMGGNSSTKSDTFDALADPAKYPQVVAEGFDQLTSMWTHRLQSLR